MDTSKEQVENYISQFDQVTQTRLHSIYDAVAKAYPQLKMKISYGMPTFYANHNILHFAGFKKHISIFPGPKAIEAFKDELTIYKLSKGTIQFASNQDIPIDLILRITKYRLDLD